MKYYQIFSWRKNKLQETKTKKVKSLVTVILFISYIALVAYYITSTQPKRVLIDEQKTAKIDTIIHNQVVYNYTSRPEETDNTPHITACNTKTSIGTIANNYYPCGTKVQIGNKQYTVLDRMNRRYGKNTWDIWNNDLAQARKFGKQTLSVTILYVPTK